MARKCFQRNQRIRDFIKTELTEIPGIGEKTAQKLLAHFGSLARLRAAEVGEVEKVVGKGGGGWKCNSILPRPCSGRNAYVLKFSGLVMSSRFISFTVSGVMRTLISVVEFFDMNSPKPSDMLL